MVPADRGTLTHQVAQLRRRFMALLWALGHSPALWPRLVRRCLRAPRTWALLLLGLGLVHYAVVIVVFVDQQGSWVIARVIQDVAKWTVHLALLPLAAFYLLNDIRTLPEPDGQVLSRSRIGAIVLLAGLALVLSHRDTASAFTSETRRLFVTDFDAAHPVLGFDQAVRGFAGDSAPSSSGVRPVFSGGDDCSGLSPPLDPGTAYRDLYQGRRRLVAVSPLVCVGESAAEGQTALSWYETVGLAGWTASVLSCLGAAYLAGVGALALVLWLWGHRRGEPPAQSHGLSIPVRRMLATQGLLLLPWFLSTPYSQWWNNYFGRPDTPQVPLVVLVTVLVALPVWDRLEKLWDGLTKLRSTLTGIVALVVVNEILQVKSWEIYRRPWDIVAQGMNVLYFGALQVALAIGLVLWVRRQPDFAWLGRAEADRE